MMAYGWHDSQFGVGDRIKHCLYHERTGIVLEVKFANGAWYVLVQWDSGSIRWRKARRLERAS
jgi:hypothetical protein